MKKSVLILLFLLVAGGVGAQDVIYKKNGEMITCKVTGSDSSKVYYTILIANYKTSIDKSEIRKIRYETYKEPVVKTEPFREGRNFEQAFTTGIMEGGGALIGVDYEIRISNGVGLQAGVGFKAFGAALNFHLKPTLKSSFIGIQYWHQGFKDSYTQSMLGPGFVYRGKHWLTCQLGLGYALGKGPAFPEDKTQPKIMLTYAIGGYVIK